MSVGKICNRSVVVIPADDSVREAARRMAQYRVGCLVVVDPDQRPVGIISDRDIALRGIGANVDPDEARVSELMTAPLRSVGEEMPIEEALALMASAGVRRLPVVDAESNLQGMLALDDVLDLLTEEAGLIRSLLKKYDPDIPVS